MSRRWNCSACVKLLPAVTCGGGGSRGWARRHRAGCARCRPWAGAHRTLTMAVFLTASPHTMRASPTAVSACPCKCQVCVSADSMRVRGSKRAGAASRAHPLNDAATVPCASAQGRACPQQCTLRMVAPLLRHSAGTKKLYSRSARVMSATCHGECHRRAVGLAEEEGCTAEARSADPGGTKQFA